MTLELFLNLAWLTLAAGVFGAFAVWAASAGSTRAAREKRVRVGLALVCGVALLFPIISVTDDMVASAAALEEWTSGRRAAQIVLSIAHTAIITSLIMAVAEDSRDVLACIGFAVLAFSPLSTACFATTWSLRAPPIARF